MRPVYTAFQIKEAPRAQSSALGESLLRQACDLPIVS
jgi:hypothetical protein